MGVGPGQVAGPGSKGDGFIKNGQYPGDDTDGTLMYRNMCRKVNGRRVHMPEHRAHDFW